MWWRFFKAIKDRDERVDDSDDRGDPGRRRDAVLPIDLIPELVLGPLGFADDLGLWGIFAVLLTREQRRWRTSLE